MLIKRAKNIPLQRNLLLNFEKISLGGGGGGRRKEKEPLNVLIMPNLKQSWVISDHNSQFNFAITSNLASPLLKSCILIRVTELLIPLFRVLVLLKPSVAIRIQQVWISLKKQARGGV